MNKYYTPSKEEFHVGFEYEVFQKGEVYDPTAMYLMPPETEDKWYKFKYPDPFLGYRLDILFKTHPLRVKYLDREIIESLGWVYCGGQMISGGKCHFSDENQIIGITLKPKFYKDGHSYIHIYELNDGGAIRNTMFSGKLKNKTEFIKELIRTKL